MPSARKLHPSRHHIISFANLLKRLCTLRYPQANLAYQLTSLLVNFLPAMFVIHDGNLPLVLRLLNPLHNSLLLSSIFMNQQEPIDAMRDLPPSYTFFCQSTKKALYASLSSGKSRLPANQPSGKFSSSHVRNS